ncbi:MAG: amino acid adenylation domain-containing protein [Cellvibrionales bacterium]|nr:amino acid adenylation domain-containing protein [Cellvibrionales bacterium]
MTPIQLMAQLGAKGIKLWLDDQEQLRFKAPKGAMTPEIKAQIAPLKSALIAFLKETQKKTTLSIKKVARDADAVFPLSFAQQRFWFLDSLEPGNAALHIVSAVRLQGGINFANFEKAFHAVINRHEMLRTFFVHDADYQLKQKVVPEVALHLQDDFDLSHLDAQHQMQKVQQIIQDVARKPFDLNQPLSQLSPFIRGQLIQLNEKPHQDVVLVMSLHHIIADGLSTDILLAELCQAYQALEKQQSPSFLPHDVQYIDFAVYQQEWLATDAFRSQLGFWEQKLDNLPQLALPFDGQLDEQQFEGDSVTITLPEALSHLLLQAFPVRETTLFSFLFAAFNLLLSRHTGQKDFAIGTPVAGREMSAIEPVFGCFINVLAIRQPIDDQLSVRAFIESCQRTLIEAQEHQSVPFEKVAERFSDAGSLSQHPLFQVLFTQQSQKIPNNALGEGINLSPVPFRSVAAKYDIQCHVEDDGADILVTFEYNRALFARNHIKDLVRHYANLVQSMLDGLDKPVSELSLFDEKDYSRLLPNFKTGFESQGLLIDQIEKVWLKKPDNIAVSQGASSITFKALHQKANCLGRKLIDLGAKPNTRVAVCLPQSIDSIIAILAVLKTGAAYVPMDTSYPKERLDIILDKAAPIAVIKHNDFDLTATIPTLCMDTFAFEDNVMLPEVSAHRLDPFYTIFTSGSTGVPKGVSVSQANATNLVHWYREEYAFTSQDKFLIISALGFDLTQKNLLLPLLLGSEIVFCESPHYDPAHISDTLYQKNITVMNCVPSAFYPVVSECARKRQLSYLSSLKTLLFGGEPINLRALLPWTNSDHFFADIHNMYGPTECTDIATTWPIKPINAYLDAPIPIGTPIDGVQLYILDQQQALVPIGTTGELYIGGLGVSLGYLNDPEQNATAFIDNPFISKPGVKIYKTGDAARYQWREDGTLSVEFLGRLDDQIKIRGFRVEPRDIAKRISEFADINDSLVMLDDRFETPRLVAYVIEGQTPMDVKACQDYLKAWLPSYMIPQDILSLDAWPLSANGKIDRKALPKANLKKREAAASQSTEADAPKTLVQRQLCELFVRKLELDQVGINENFFELGGHSILATQVVGEIQQTFGVDFSVRDFFESPTVEAIGQQVEQADTMTGLQQAFPIMRVSRQSMIPLSSAQERLWVIEQMRPGSSSYLIPFALKLTQSVDSDRLALALTQVVERHESLRTAILTDGQNEAYQKLLPVASFNLQSIETPNAQTALEEAKRFALTPFAFDESPLFRAALITPESDAPLFVASFHHMICDAWSLAVFRNDLIIAYGDAKDSHLSFEPLNLQYADFSVWQRQYLASEAAQAHLDYWVDQLTPLPQVLHLPIDRERPQVQSVNGDLMTQPLESSLVEQLQGFSTQQGITCYQSLLSVFFILLNKLSKQSDICVGTPISGRHMSSLQSIIGYFVNAVVIRQDVSQSKDFLSLCRQTTDTVLGAFAHQDIPIERIFRQLPLDRDLSINPVAQVGFNYVDDTLLSTEASGDLAFELIELAAFEAKYDLTLHVIHQQSEITLKAEYNTDLFDASTINTLLSQYTTLLAHCVDNPNAALVNLDIVDIAQLADQRNLPKNAGDWLLLNAMQKDMVLAQSLYPAARANTLGYQVEVPFVVDENRWQQAIHAVIAAYPICRTQLVENTSTIGEMAYQYQAASLAVTVELFDWQDMDSPPLERIHAFVYQPEAYQKGEFFRYGLAKLSGNKTLLMMSAHHAIVDGMSVDILARLHIKAYEALSQGEVPQLEEAYPLRDYTLNNRAILDAPETVAFWQNELAPVEALQFPPQALTTHEESTHQMETVTIDNAHWDAVIAFCKKRRTTPAMFCKVLYSYLIATYCRAESAFSLTEFVAQRDKSQIDALGCFFEQLPFVVPNQLLTPESTFDDWLKAGHDLHRRSKSFRRISKGVSAQLQPLGSLQFMFNFYHFLPEAYDICGEQAPCAEVPPFVEGAVQFIVKAQAHQTSLELYYQPHLFTALDFLERFKQLSLAVIETDQPLGKFTGLMPQESHCQQIAFHGNVTESTLGHPTLAHALLAQSDATPDAIALCAGDQSLTYRALGEKTNQLAHWLKNQGVGPDNRVAVCLHRSLDAILAILGIIKAGAAYVPLDPAHPETRLNSMLASGNIDLVFAEKSQVDLFSERTVIDLSSSVFEAELAALPKTPLTLLPTPDDLAYVIFTSGSTGAPKGAAVTHANVMNLQHWYTKEMQAGENSRFLLISSPGFDLTQKNIFAPLISGGRLVIYPERHYDAHKIADLMQKAKITDLNCAPSLFYPLVEDIETRLHIKTLNNLCLGGESIQMNRLMDWYSTSSTRMVNHYGPTECTDIAAFYPLPKNLASSDHLPIGRPNDNVQLYIVGVQHQLIASGLVGEIAISGKGVGRGYLNQSALNREKFIPNPFGEGQLYLTGDLGYWDNEGQCVFVGRKDFQLKINGQRFEAKEVEHHCKHLAGILDALVMIKQGQLVAYLVGERDYINSATWKTELAEFLPAYMIPNHLVFLDDWPRNNNGKIDRHALPNPELAMDKPLVLPEDETESAVLRIIKDAVDASNMSMDDNFFHLGGNSLSASRALMQIRQRFDVEIPLHMIFDLNTPKALSDFIKASQQVMAQKQKPESSSAPRVQGSI